ncbi:MAG: HNH endonuclease [Armatimonadetes bacterium]|nr:HNH endonuclease [Armatimonadota bacterium]
MYLQEPTKDGDYYQFSLLGNEGGPSTLSWQSHWTGFTEGKPRLEIRAASLVEPEKMRSVLKRIGEPPVIVNSEDEFRIWQLWGGHALIESRIAQDHFPAEIEGGAVATLTTKGYVTASSVDPSLLHRAPTRRSRMDVLKRDSMRCMICGQRPCHDVQVELEVHHITPWSTGGLTEAENLITLCTACHDGLKPHGELSLYEHIGVDLAEKYRLDRNYVEQLRRHHKWVISALQKLQRKELI